MYVVYTHSVVGVARCYAIKSLRCSRRRSFPRAGVIFDEPPSTPEAAECESIARDRSAIRVPSLSRDERLPAGAYFSLVHSAPMLTTSANHPPARQRASVESEGRLSRCALVYYICEGLARIPANLPAGLEDLISSRTDRNTCKPVTKKAFLIMHPTQLFLVTQSRRRARRTASEGEKERRAFSIIRCNQPFSVMQKARLDYAS